jgi:hypothetical protein
MAEKREKEKGKEREEDRRRIKERRSRISDYRIKQRRGGERNDKEYVEKIKR